VVTRERLHPPEPLPGRASPAGCGLDQLRRVAVLTQPRGLFTFDRNYTSNAGAANTGHPFASFLLGYPNRIQRSFVDTYPEVLINFVGFFVQETNIRWGSLVSVPGSPQVFGGHARKLAVSSTKKLNAGLSAPKSLVARVCCQARTWPARNTRVNTPADIVSVNGPLTITASFAPTEVDDFPPELHDMLVNTLCDVVTRKGTPANADA